MRELETHGADLRRAATRFCLVDEQRHYPPKYVVSLAVQQAFGTRLKPSSFSGGAETNGLLRRLGFDVLACTCGGLSQSDERSYAVGRLVVNGPTPEQPREARHLLLQALTREWPAGSRVRFLVTPGGFAWSRCPGGWPSRVSWSSHARDATGLVKAAELVFDQVVTPRVRGAAAGKVEVLTIGIDLANHDDTAHAELVAVFDVKLGKVVRWTGKSYPTPRQERSLFQFADLNTHLLKIAGERVLVLGCHDLNMFSPRAWANQARDGERRRRSNEMRTLARAFEPTVVLQHPHNTDSPNIWRMPWLALARMLPSVKVWASGIAYNRHGQRRRAPLDRVRELTRSSPTLDIVVGRRRSST